MKSTSTSKRISPLQKTTNIFNRGFFIFYTFLFTITLFGGIISVAIFGELNTEYPMPVIIVVLRFTALILSFVGIAAAFIALCRILSSEKRSRIDARRFNTKIIFGCVGLMLIFQLIAAFCLRMNPITDVASVDSYARRIVTDNSFDCLDTSFNNHYIIRYQNNIFILLFTTLVYKITYALTGSISYTPMIILSTLAINSAVLMTVLTARRVFGERKALFTLMLCAFFAPYYTYTPYFYTDSFSLPLVAGTVYVFTVATQSKKRSRKALLLLISGAICFIGFKMKGSVIILIPALLIYMLLKYGIKRAAKMSAALLLSFCMLFAGFTVAFKNSHIISEESSERYQFPAAHWVMMGVKDFGAFNFDDDDFSKSYPNKTERQEANIKEIGRRVNEMGFFGMAVHLGKKAVWTYMDGTYYVANYLQNPQQRTPLQDFVLYNGKYRFGFFSYSFGYQMFLMAMIAYSGLCARRKGETGMTTLFRIAIFGMVLFFLIWETNSRYPFNFTPLYMLLATEGAFGFVEHRKAKKAKKYTINTQNKP